MHCIGSARGGLERGAGEAKRDEEGNRWHSITERLGNRQRKEDEERRRKEDEERRKREEEEVGGRQRVGRGQMVVGRGQRVVGRWHRGRTEFNEDNCGELK